ncbi:MAG: RagB/SusD family nutrient uptake outer membrane protein [Sediminicola sp.]|tara:strand:+ start:124993 stop:126471 length:1479 start_codon:yes stop_codon:yes gene_type:complete
MKKFKLIVTLLFFGFVTNSCDENDLFVNNPNELSPESFFATGPQVESAVNAVYANLQTIGLYSRGMFFMMDNLAHENAGNSQLEADKLQYLNFSFDSSHGLIGAYWESCYRGINKANFVIENQEKINAISDNLLSTARKDKYVGEAKFLRALFYFFLVTRFGDVPLIVDLSGEEKPRAAAADVYALIVADLQDAQNALLEKGSDDIGRATRGAATALLGKVYLFMDNKPAALAEFNKIYGQYSLEDDFYDNFTEEGEHGPESIFEIQYDDELGTAAQWNSDVSGEGANEATFRGQEYGLLNWFNVYPSDRLLDEYEAGDPRYQATFYSVGDTYSAGVITEGNLTAGSQRRAGWRKYQNYYKDASEDQESGINFNYLRYADVLLMMAECTYESDPGAAIGYINEVRQRPSVDLAPLSASGMSTQDIFEAIVHERMVELAGEQIRFNDIIRWGIASTALEGTNFREDIHTLLPIPDREIGTNSLIGPEDQNPGY